MTSTQIRQLLAKKIARTFPEHSWEQHDEGVIIDPDIQTLPETIAHILIGSYNQVEFRRQGNFTLAILISTNHPEYPTLYGMSKRNAKCDIEDVDLGRKVALSAVIENQMREHLGRSNLQ